MDHPRPRVSRLTQLLRERRRPSMIHDTNKVQTQRFESLSFGIKVLSQNVSPNVWRRILC